MQDSKSNRKSVFATLGASDHSDGERAYRDLYCTHPSAVESLLKVETFSRDIWEPAAGLLHISKHWKSMATVSVHRTSKPVAKEWRKRISCSWTASSGTETSSPTRRTQQQVSLC